MPAATVARVDSAGREATAPRGHRRRRGRHRPNTARPPPPLGTARSDSHRSDRATPPARPLDRGGDAPGHGCRRRIDRAAPEFSIARTAREPTLPPTRRAAADTSHPDGTLSDELDDSPWSTVRDRSGHQNIRIDHDPERLSHGRPSAVGRPERCQFLGCDQLGLALRQGIGRRCVLTSELVEQPAQVRPDDESLHRFRDDHIDRHASTLSFTARRRQQLVADLHGRGDDRVLPHSEHGRLRTATTSVSPPSVGPP